MDYILQELNISNIDMIKDFYVDVFTNEPWNDDWSNEKQFVKFFICLWH